MSINWLAGPFNGTGFFNEIVDDAIASGIIWGNSAGNYAQSHWEGNFYDPDGNNSEGESAVTTVELQNAIHHWIENIPVRGHIMSTADIQEIIVIWLSK